MMHDDLIQRLYARTDSAGIADALCHEAARALNQGEMEMSDTPKCDECAVPTIQFFGGFSTDEEDWMPGSKARTLERELQAEVARREAAEAELEQYRNLRTDKTAVRVNLLRGLLARPNDLIFTNDTEGPYALLKAERDTLRAELERNRQ